MSIPISELEIGKSYYATAFSTFTEELSIGEEYEVTFLGHYEFSTHKIDTDIVVINNMEVSEQERKTMLNDGHSEKDAGRIFCYARDFSDYRIIPILIPSDQEIEI